MSNRFGSVLMQASSVLFGSIGRSKTVSRLSVDFHCINPDGWNSVLNQTTNSVLFGSVRSFSGSSCSSSIVPDLDQNDGGGKSEIVNWRKLECLYPVSDYPSIESIKLKIDDKSKAPRQIYGLIKVPSPCFPIFYRHGDDPQLVPDGDDDGDSDGFPLILCGPNHCLQDDEMCEKITVELYGERSQPFMTGKFFLTENTNNGRVQVPLQEYIYLPDGLGRLTLTYTRIRHAHPAIFQFRLVHGGERVCEAAAVTGTIRGIHCLPEGSATNWLTIFDSRGEDVAVADGELIPIDRFNFVLPVQIGKEGEKGFYGGSFDIDVDLQVVVNHKVFSIKGETKVALSRLDVKEELEFKFFTVGQLSSGGPVIKFSVELFHDYWPEIDDIESVEH